MDRMFADEEALRDGVVAEADRDEAKHLDLPDRQAAALSSGADLGRGRRHRLAGCSIRPWRAKAPGLRDSCEIPRSRAGLRQPPVRGARAAPITRASSTRARAGLERRAAFLNKSTASSRWRRAVPASPERADATPAARLARARSGSVCACAAMSSSSSTAVARRRRRPARSRAAHQFQRRRRARFGSAAGSRRR